MHSLLRRILIGEPLPTRRRSAERLNLFYGLAVFASDALSSTAYATEEILLILASRKNLGPFPARWRAQRCSPITSCRCWSSS